jgi:hypothetical protein
MAGGQLLVLGLLGAAGLGGCGPDAPPARPSFERDVKPITVANCVRCHNATTLSDPTVLINKPTNGVFDHYEDPAGCDVRYQQTDAQGNVTGVLDVGPCFGLAHYAAPGMCQDLIVCSYIDAGVMPPAPAPKLSARDVGIIQRWLGESPPDP